MKVTPEIESLTGICKEHTSLDLSLYQKYDVKRGLRDINGKGVLAGLTQVSNVCAVKVVDGKEAMTLRSLPEDLLKMTDTVSRRLPISCCLANFPMRRSFRALPGFWRIRDPFPPIL